MKRRLANPVKIGAFVVGGLVILVFAVLWIGSGRMFRSTHPFVSYFDGSVNGLRAGASVKFKGVEVGKVDRIRIPAGLTQTDQPIAVYFSLDGDKLDDTKRRAPEPTALLQGAIDNGLRAQLVADSLVTGILHVSLAYLPETEVKMHEPSKGVMEIPTIPPPMQEIGAGIRSIVDRIDRYPFERLFDRLQSALEAFTELSRAPELRSSLASLDQTLKDVDAAVVRLDKHLDPLAMRLQALLERGDTVGGELQQGLEGARATLASMQKMSDQVASAVPALVDSLQTTGDRLQAMAVAMEATLESTRVLFDPRAPLAIELRAGLRELRDAARASRDLLELLERNPDALLRGKGAVEGDSR